MSRVQLALNVTDLDKAIAFYSRLFDTAPAKVKPGYANFAIADPPLKLVLFRGSGGSGAGLETTGVEDTICCYAEKTETWMADPDGARWEWYVKSGDAGQLHKTAGGSHSSCATALPRPAAREPSRCTSDP